MNSELILLPDLSIQIIVLFIKNPFHKMFVRRMIVPNKKFNLEMNDLNILNSTYIFSDIKPV